MKFEHNDDCASRRGYECDCGCDETKAIEENVNEKVYKLGKKVIFREERNFRSGKIAEIVGWCSIKGSLHYTIRFSDLLTVNIPANDVGMRAAGYEFVD
ncbi:MAG: hypothetical protein PHP54_03335 [Clostridia bacterium]|nr:hypothetical protein [Clostridia bacterium]